jgi:hypothetical protein
MKPRNDVKKLICILCKEMHEIDVCEKFLKLPMDGKRRIYHRETFVLGMLEMGLPEQ